MRYYKRGYGYGLSLVPGTSRLEPDGLQYGERRKALELVAKCTDVIGINVVELNSALDLSSQATAFLTTQIAIEMLAFSRSVKD